MENWTDDIGYSVNKNRRWELQEHLKKVFHEDINALKEEPFHVFALIMPDPNTIQQQYLKHGVPWNGEARINGNTNSYSNNPKYFNSSTEGCGKINAKRNFVISRHGFKPEKDVKLLIEDDESRSYRQKLFKIKDYRSRRYRANIMKSSRTRLTRSLDKQLESIYYQNIADDDYEYEGYPSNLIENEMKETAASNLLEDYMYRYTHVHKKNTTRTEVSEKQRKGKLIYDPNQPFTQLDDADVDDEEFVEVEEYDPNCDSVILCLDI